MLMEDSDGYLFCYAVVHGGNLIINKLFAEIVP